MASAIVEALPGKRNILSTGIMMFHRARGGVSGQFESGELEARLDFYKTMVREMEKTNASRVGLSLEAYKSKVLNEWWIMGSDSIKTKVSDEIVTVSCTPKVVDAKSIEVFEFMGMEMEVEFSACPLIKSGKLVIPKQEENYNMYRKEKWSMRGAL